MQLSSEALVGAFALHAEKNGSGSLAHRSELKAARERGVHCLMIANTMTPCSGRSD
jgi:hypothetical protein